ncbi:MAG: crossover junction endodeoxyribonuclease RuvC [Candidatus Hydrogenedentota bacterium]
MRVLGFDPGTATTGYGIVEGKGNKLIHIAHGVITTPPEDHFAVRLQSIYDEVVDLIRIHAPQAVAIEELFFTKNVTTGITVAQARGVIALAAAQSGLPIGEFSPREMKSAVAGYGKADKKQIQEMVKILLNLDALPKPDDAADALGIAICQIHTGNFQAITGQ